MHEREPNMVFFFLKADKVGCLNRPGITGGAWL